MRNSTLTAWKLDHRGKQQETCIYQTHPVIMVHFVRKTILDVCTLSSQSLISRHIYFWVISSHIWGVDGADPSSNATASKKQEAASWNPQDMLLFNYCLGTKYLSNILRYKWTGRITIKYFDLYVLWTRTTHAGAMRRRRWAPEHKVHVSVLPLF